MTDSDIEKAVGVMDEALVSLLPLIENDYSRLARRKK